MPLRDRQPFERLVRCRIVAKADSIGLLVRITDAGIPVRAMVSPVVPALTDHELEAIVTACAQAGAVAASSIVLRLPREVAGLFRDWLEEAFPDRAARVMARVRELHGGQDYDSAFGTRMTGQGEWANLMQQRFRLITRKLGLDRSLPKLHADLFAVPPKVGDQLALF